MITERRYDLDWIRVIAIALLIAYHVAVVFQPWGLMIGFITNSESWEKLWLPMTILNVWRIPILFFVSGMGVFFSFQHRNWKQLLKERALRIGIPFVFGFVLIAPIYLLILQNYYGWKLQYIPQMAHLWFLGNILCYIMLSIVPLHLLRSKTNSLLAIKLRKLFSSYFIFPLIVFFFITETVLVNPIIYEMYAETLHGFVLGFLAFISGYLFVFSGDRFWNNLVKLKWFFLLLAVLFFTTRTNGYFSLPLQINLPIETCLWIFSIFAFAKQYLNKSNHLLPYLSRATYPVYILHMIFLGLSANFVLPLAMSVQLKFCCILLGTISGSLLCYELIKRIHYLSLLLGISNKRK